MGIYDDYYKRTGFGPAAPQQNQTGVSGTTAPGFAKGLTDSANDWQKQIDAQQMQGFNKGMAVANAGVGVAMTGLGAAVGPNPGLYTTNAGRRGQKAAKGMEVGASVASGVLGGLAMAGVSANAVPIAGQVASAALLLAAGLTKLFAGKRQAKKQRRQSQEQRNQEFMAGTADRMSLNQSQTGGYGYAQQEMQPEGVTPFDMPESSYFKG